MTSSSNSESEVIIKAKRVKYASYKTAVLSAEVRNKVLQAISDKLNDKRTEIREINQKDIENGKNKGLSTALLDRLLLNDTRIDGMIQGIQEIIMMEDKLGNIENMIKRPNGLLIGQMLVPLGTIAMIYEARPNVTIDAAVLCIKSGNTILLRGGSEAIHSNIYLTQIMQEAAYGAGLPEGSIEMIENTDRVLVDELVKQNDFIDVLIPRGGAKFIKHILSIAQVPCIETGAGNCHTYIDKFADIDKAIQIVHNGKVQRPSVCNATKKVLVHKDIAKDVMNEIQEKLKAEGVVFLTDINTQKEGYFKEDSATIATEEEWYEEFLDMRLGIKIIESLDSAIEHINKYSSHHTEAIVTKDYERAMKFIRSIDSASLIWNASTRFTDGGEFGLGAEIGISTQKLHWRGPISIYQLMSKKFVTFGSGQIRK